MEFSDVFIGLIGFGEDLKWPRHYTSNNNVNIEGGDISHMSFSNKGEPKITLQEAKEDKQISKKLQYIKQRLDVELGSFKLTDGYSAAIRYPFRAGAAKAVVGLVSQPCEKSPLSPFSVGLRAYSITKSSDFWNLFLSFLSFPYSYRTTGCCSAATCTTNWV